MSLAKRRLRMAGKTGGECMWYCGCSLARTMFFGSALLLLFTEAVAVRAEQQPKVEVVPAIGHSSSCTSVAFSPEGARVLSASWNGTVKLWDVATGRLIRTFAAG